MDGVPIFFIFKILGLQNTKINFLPGLPRVNRCQREYIPGDDLNRDSFEEPLLTSNLVRKIEEINKDIGIGEEEIRLVLNELKLKGSGQDGCRHILDYLKFGVPVKFEKERVVNYVQLFDYKNAQNNSNKTRLDKVRIRPLF